MIPSVIDPVSFVVIVVCKIPRVSAVPSRRGTTYQIRRGQV